MTRGDEQLRRRNAELTALHETAVDLIERRDTQGILQAIVERAGALVGTDTGFVYFANDDGETMTSRVDTGAFEPFLGFTIRRGEGLGGRVWDTGHALVVDEYRSWAEHLRAFDEAQVGAVVGIPLFSEGTVCGVLGLGYTEAGRTFGPDDVAVLERLGRLGSLAIERARLLEAAEEQLAQRRAAEEQLRRRNAELVALHETAVDLIHRRSLDDLLQAIVERACALAGTPHGDLHLVEPDGEHALLRVGTGAFASMGGSRVRLGEGAVGRAWETGRPFVVEDYSGWSGAMPEFRGLQIRAALTVPLISGARIVGVLGIVSTEPDRTFGDEAVGLLERFARLAALALENARLAEAAEQELAHRRAAEEALQVAETRYRALIEQLPAVVYLDAVDPPGMSLYMSPRIIDMVGYTPEELVAPDRWASLVHPEDRDRVRREIARTDSREPISSEYRVIARDGRTLWVRDEWVVLRDDADRPVSLQGVLFDITERRLLEEQLRQAAKMEAVGQLAGGIAHDFNNLLTAIDGYASLLVAALEPGDERRGDAEAIAAASDRAAQLVRQLLTFSRRAPAGQAVIDLNDVVASLDGLLRRLIGEHIRLTTTLGASVGAVREDRSRLEQVLINLAVNARDAMPEGGLLSIATREETLGPIEARDLGLSAGRYACLVVGDTGSGMDEETRAHIFEPFFTTKEPGQGTGLGLATAYAIVTGAGGGIDIASAPARGTTFVIRLPVVGEVATQATAQEPDAQAPNGRGETVLVVEDEDAVRRLIREALERAGYTVLAAEDGPTGIRLAREAKTPISLVISDLIMPGIRGRDAVAAIRTVQPNVPVLYVSGYADPRTIAGLDGPLLAKPFSARSLLDRVRSVLEGSGPAR